MADGKASELLGYSVYLLDGRGRIRTSRRLHAASDECAVWILANLGLTERAELWRLGRRIATLDAAQPPKTTA